jgi:hypothetical protein
MMSWRNAWPATCLMSATAADGPGAWMTPTTSALSGRPPTSVTI